MRWLPVVLWVLVISLLSFSGLDEVPLPSFLGWDKLGHFSMYFILEYLLLIPLNKKLESLLKWSFVVILYAGTTELIQHFLIENRNGEWMDFLANCSGVLLAYSLLRRKNKN